MLCNTTFSLGLVPSLNSRCFYHSFRVAKFFCPSVTLFFLLVKKMLICETNPCFAKSALCLIGPKSKEDYHRIVKVLHGIYLFTNLINLLVTTDLFLNVLAFLLLLLALMIFRKQQVSFFKRSGQGRQILLRSDLFGIFLEALIECGHFFCYLSRYTTAL